MAADLNQLTLDNMADRPILDNDMGFDELPPEVQDKMMEDFMNGDWEGASAPDETRFVKRSYDENHNMVVPSDVDMSCDMSLPEPNDGEISIYPISYVQELEMKVASYENILAAQDKQSDELSKKGEKKDGK